MEQKLQQLLERRRRTLTYLLVPTQEQTTDLATAPFYFIKLLQVSVEPSLFTDEELPTHTHTHIYIYIYIHLL